MTAEGFWDQVRVRKYEHRDRDAIRSLCRRSAFRNMGADAFFEDWSLIVDYFSVFYTDYTPETIWLVECGGQVSGYLFGCTDTNRFLKLMGSKIVPTVLSKAIWHLARGRYAEAKSRRFLRWLALKSWREIPRIPINKFPAHIHCNLLPVVCHKKLLTRLTLIFIDHLEQKGISGMHMQTLEPQSFGMLKRLAAKSEQYLADWAYFYDEKPTAFFKDIIGFEEKMINRALGSTVSDFKKVIHSVQLHHRI
jgi:hypothetical protein